MKKNKKILSSLILALTLLLSGCGENAVEPDNEPKRTSNATETQAALKTENTETAHENVIQTEPENTSPDESLFAYYDLLNEEYEKYGVTSPIEPFADFGGIQNVSYFPKEKTIMIPYKKKGNHILFLYNIEDKNKTKNPILSEVMYPTFCNNRLYYTIKGAFYEYVVDNVIHVRNYDGTLLTMNDIEVYGFLFNGENELWDNLNSIDSIFSQPDGTVFLRCFVGTSFPYKKVTFMVSPDYLTLTVLPEIEVEVEHGFTNTRDYNILACYNNKLFVEAPKDGFYCIDANSMTHRKLDFNLEEEAEYNYGSSTLLSSSYKCIGRYILFKHSIYDMENEEVFMRNDSFPGSFAKSYYGGKHNIINKDGKWIFYKCPSDGSAIDLDETESYDMEEKDSSKCKPISEKYYIYQDSYGFFLRTYEKGAEGEETIWLESEMNEAVKNN